MPSWIQNSGAQGKDLRLLGKDVSQVCRAGN